MNFKATKAYIKIKHAISSSYTSEHIEVCRKMIDLATSIITSKEKALLKLLADAKETQTHIIDPIMEMETNYINPNNNRLK